MYIQRRLVNQHIGFVVIMIFEFFGTLLFTYVNLLLINSINQTQSSTLKEIYTSLFFALSLFLCLTIGRQFSGGLYNPSVVIYRMLRIKQRFTIKIGLSYLTTQFAGAITGSILAFSVNDLQFSSIMKEYDVNYQIKLMFSQAIGTFVLATMVQYINQKKMTFIQHNREFYVCIPLFFLISRVYASLSNGLNPALGFGYQLGYCIFHSQWEIFYQTYILIAGPIIGTIIAVIIFQFLLKPFYPLKKSQIQKQIEQIQKMKQQERIKQEQYVLSRISKISNVKQKKVILNEQKINYSKHKYTLNQINSLKPDQQVYLNINEQHTIVQDITFYDQVYSIPDSQSNYQKQLQQISFNNYSFKQQHQTNSMHIKSIPKLSQKKISQRLILQKY